MALALAKYSPLPPRWRKVIQDLWSNKTRTALVVLSIAVGIFAVGSVAGSRVILEQDLTAQYLPSNDRSAQINASNIDDDFIKSIRDMPEVADAQGRFATVFRMKIGERRTNLLLYGIPDFNDIRINSITFDSGDHEPPWRQVLLDRGSLELFGVHEGDSLSIELPDGTMRNLGIAGVVHDINAPPPNFSNFGTAFATYDTIAWLGFPKANNQFRIRVSEGLSDRQHIQDVVDKIKKRVEDSGRTFYGFGIQQSPNVHYAWDPVTAITLILTVLGAFSLFLSAFLVVNTITALMAQQLKQIGIMKAVGAKGWQIGALYMTLVFVFGLISLAVAIPLGALGAQGFAGYISGLLNFDILTKGVPTNVWLIELGVGLLIPIVAALAPVLSGLRVSVREALYSSGLGESKKQKSRPSAQPRRSLFSFVTRSISRPMLISLRNTFRKVGRLALTLGTLTLASAIFISVWTVRDSLTNTLDKSVRVWNYDISVNLEHTQQPEKAVRELLQIPGVTQAEGWITSGGRRLRDDGTESRPISILAPPGGSQLLRPQLVEGRLLLPDDVSGVVVSSDVINDEPDVRVGDQITMKFGPRRFKFEIVGIAENTLAGNVGNSRVMYMNEEGYRKVLAAGPNVSNFIVVTELHDAQSRQAVGAAIEEQFKRLQMRVDNFETISERRGQIEFQFNILVVFLLLMAALLAVVGGLGLAGTMSMNVLERTREIGVLRAVGASDGAVRGIVIVEGLLIGFISWAIGALVAIPISQTLSGAVGQAFLRGKLAYVFSTNGVFIWLAAVLIIATIASLVPALRASRLTVREVLSYE